MFKTISYSFVKSNKTIGFIASIKDKFGDHGIIGSYVLIQKKNFIFITDFLLSCRILSRKIEEYLIYLIIKKYKNKEVFLRYIKTDKNKELIKVFLTNNSLNKKKSLNKFKIKGELYKIVLNERLQYAKKFF